MSMEERQRLANLLIPKRGQPSRFGGIHILVEVHADGLDKQDFGESRDDRLRTGSVRIQLFYDVLDRQAKPRSGIAIVRRHVDQRRKDGEKRIGRTILKSHSSAHEFRDGSAAAGAHNPLLIWGVPLNEIEEINRAGARSVLQLVTVAPR